MTKETFKILIINLIFSFMFALVLIKIGEISYKESSFLQAIFVSTSIFYTLANIIYIVFYSVLNIVKFLIRKRRENELLK
jgi:type III secretory pathway component EscU